MAPCYAGVYMESHDRFSQDDGPKGPAGSPGSPSWRDRPGSSREQRGRAPLAHPPLRLLTTTLWEYPSQHYDPELAIGPADPEQRPTGRPRIQGDKHYIGATPSWVIWQLLQRYTREGDTVVDPMCGSGTTVDVCGDLKRKAVGFDLSPTRPDITLADARSLPMRDASADFFFVDPPYSTHVQYSEDVRCIGKLDASQDDGQEYYTAMRSVISEAHRVLKDRRYMALYVSDSWRKRQSGTAVFMPIGFALYSMMCDYFKPIDIISVVRHNHKLTRGNWKKSAEEGNFFLRGFNYLFIVKKEGGPEHKQSQPRRTPQRTSPPS